MTKESSKDAMKVYEVGFHIAPFVGEENVPHEVSLVKNVLDSVGAEIISEDFPRLKVLVYPISKVIKGDKKICSEAYFGWIKFEVSSDKIESVKADIEKIESIIRFLVIATVRENTLYASKILKEKGEVKEKKEGDKKEVKEEVNEAELDKSIEDLVV